MVRDIVGLYQNPPDKGMVLCVVEKTQFQALDWTQPLLPIGLGYVEGITHDYFRHGHVQGQRQAMVEVPAKRPLPELSRRLGSTLRSSDV